MTLDRWLLLLSVIYLGGSLITGGIIGLVITNRLLRYEAARKRAYEKFREPTPGLWQVKPLQAVHNPPGWRPPPGT